MKPVSAPVVADSPDKIQAIGFSFFYGQTEALHSLDLAVKRSSLLTIMGPTGSGKTTLLRALNRLNDRVVGTKYTGQLLLDGNDVYGPGVDVAELRRRVGMVFALPVSLPLSIYDNVAYGPRKKGIRSRTKLDAMVEKALVDAAIFEEIKDRLHSPAQHLSGGQQQRLALARVLAVEPEVILLDEPTSGLDPLSTFRIEETLRQLKEHYTIILVTHDSMQAARINSDVAFLYLGELVEIGPAAEIFTRPRDRRTEDYITGKFG
ncbi:MAG TPA: phosphate ABC transporter ATP-binding protein [Firmicutes bacterium]|nr:phosphate ABC transporter ATP-binding protein [Bacillota bacterium]